MLGYYITVKSWSPDCKPCEASFGNIMVWIRITRLSIWYYHEKAIMHIASAIGKPVKVDLATKLVERGKFARACVQVNLGLLVVQRVVVDDYKYSVEYECLQLICEKCNCFGNVASECSVTVITSASVDDQVGAVDTAANHEKRPSDQVQQVFKFRSIPINSVPIVDSAKKIKASTLHRRKEGMVMLGKKRAALSFVGKERGKVGKIGKAQFATKGKKPLIFWQQMGRTRNGPKKEVKEPLGHAGLASGSYSSQARQTSMKDRVKIKDVAAVARSITFTLKNDHRRLHLASLQNSLMFQANNGAPN
ncbi:uncharacterized protein LOC130966018 [Arachis stenosperma]|uniref:uncharacterized protein LOC130966018 n=1 Tax=Arachis stenosperma TaxID=217475 RepID=UPI0025AC9969|nr:uncharacterized protein LOC130966018 [Arachis stenosperma]